MQTLAMNSWMWVYARWGPPVSSESSMSCTMGVPEGATDGAMEGVIDGLRGKVGGSTGVFEADRVITWEEA